MKRCDSNARFMFLTRGACYFRKPSETVKRHGKRRVHPSGGIARLLLHDTRPAPAALHPPTLSLPHKAFSNRNAPQVFYNQDNCGTHAHSEYRYQATFTTRRIHFRKHSATAKKTRQAASMYIPFGASVRPRFLHFTHPVPSCKKALLVTGTARCSIKSTPTTKRQTEFDTRLLSQLKSGTPQLFPKPSPAQVWLVPVDGTVRVSYKRGKGSDSFFSLFFLDSFAVVAV